MMRRRSLAWVLGLAWIVGCAGVDTLEIRVFDPGRDSGSADFTVFLALGSSLTAGVQNAGLAESGQRRGYAALIARQLDKLVLTGAVDGAVPAEFVLPGVSDPGTEGTLILTSLVPPEIEPVENPGQPVNTMYPGVYNNLAVPGANAADVFTTVSSPFNPAYTLVLRNQGTMLELAGALQPTFVVLWLGENEVLGKVTRNAPIPAVQDFEDAYRTVVDALAGLGSAPDLVTANVPDVTSIPLVTTVPPFLVDPNTREPVLVGGQLVPLIGPDGPLVLPGPGGPGDRVTLEALEALAMGDGVPQAFGGTGAPLADAVVLNVAEQAAVAAAIEAYNAVIAEVAGEYGFPVVDMNALLREFVQGVEVGGITHTAEFITGGAFGLDGIHATNLGYAVTANAFIHAMNGAYGSSIPPVDLSEFVSAD
jgi:lysophospholipase L1-like esterase